MKGCFCHFNGYEVKDAAARKSIEEQVKQIKDLKRNFDEDVPELLKDQLSERAVTPQMFGAVGDGVTDDSDAFQAAIDASNSVFVPAGTYLIHDVKLKSNLKITGENRKSIIRTPESYEAKAFVYEGLTQFVEIYNLTFTGYGVAISYINKEDYYFLATAHIAHCHFFADLTCCIRANMILSTVEHCTFGYHGNYNPSGNHSHIEVVTSASGNNATFNRLIRNMFYRATVCSCRFESVRHLYFDGNNWEQNRPEKYTIILKGCFGHNICNNWFEFNDCDCDVYTGLNDENTSSAYVQKFDHNYIYMLSTAKAFVESQDTNTLEFCYNMGNMQGVPLTINGWDNSVTNALDAYYGNHIYNLGGAEITERLGLTVSASMAGLNDNPWFRNFNYASNTEGWSKVSRTGISAGTLTDSLGNGLKFSLSNQGYNYFYKTFPAWYLKGKRLIVKAIGRVDSTDGADALRIGVNYTEAAPSMLSWTTGEAISGAAMSEITAEVNVPADAAYVHIGLFAGGTTQSGHLAAFDVFICDNPMIIPNLSNR